MTMGSREIAYRAHKKALHACARARKLFGMASTQLRPQMRILLMPPAIYPDRPLTTCQTEDICHLFYRVGDTASLLETIGEDAPFSGKKAT